VDWWFWVTTEDTRKPIDVLGGAYVKTKAELLAGAVTRAEQAEATAEKLKEDYNRSCEIAAEERGKVDKEREERARAIAAESTAEKLREELEETERKLTASESHATALGAGLQAIKQSAGFMSCSCAFRVPQEVDAIFAALSDSDSNTLRREDIQIDVYSNERDASIRVTHKPTGIVVKRDVGKNESRLQARESALRELQAKVSDSNTEGKT
jgi:hypothetical protein